MKAKDFYKVVSVLIIGLMLPCGSIFGQVQFEKTYIDFLNSTYFSDSTIREYIHFAEKKLYSSPDSVIAYGKVLLQRISTHGHRSYESEAYELMGKASTLTGEKDSAQYYFEKSLAFRKRDGEPKAIVRAYYNLGLLMRRSGEYEEALTYYLQGIDFSQETIPHPTLTLGNLYSSIGLVYGSLEQDESALNALERGLEIREEISDSIGIGTSYLSIGNFYAQRKQFALAEDSYQESLAIYSILNYDQGLFRVKESLANVQFEQNHYEEALITYQELLQFVDRKGDKKFQASLKNNIGSALNELNRYEEAIIFLQDGINTIDGNDHSELALSLHINLSKAMLHRQAFAQAYSELEEALEIQSSIIEEKAEAIQKESDLRLQIEEQSFQLQLEKEQAIAEQAQIELANHHLRTGIIIGVLLLLVGVGWMMSRFYIRRRRLNFEHRIDRLLHQQEEIMFGAMIRGQEQAYSSIAQELHDNIGMLLAATNLHFSSLEEKLDSQLETFRQAKSTLLKAVKEVRTLSRDMLSGTLHHLGLVESIENVLEVVKQTGQYEVKLELSNLEDAEIPPSITHSLYRSIQELLSNVIKHADASQIDLHLLYQNNELILVFKDNGIGIQIKPDRVKSGMGLLSIQSRITEHGGTYEIDGSSQDGTTIMLRLPLPESRSEWVAKHVQSSES